MQKSWIRGWVLIKVHYKLWLLKEKTNISSRVTFENILLGYNAVEYSERVPRLIEATKKAENKNEKNTNLGKYYHGECF